jgi:hypothetical protein
VINSLVFYYFIKHTDTSFWCSTHKYSVFYFCFLAILSKEYGVIVEHLKVLHITISNWLSWYIINFVYHNYLLDHFLSMRPNH